MWESRLIINEFETGYICDLKINENTCPPSYESLVHKFDWSGSYRGCVCLCLEKNGEFEFYPLYSPLIVNL